MNEASNNIVYLMPTAYYMKEENYTTVSVSHFSEQMDTPIIKNFIVSNGEQPHIAFGHPYIIDGIAIIICIKGEGSMRINLKEYEVNKNTIATIVPGSILELIWRSDDCQIEFLFFSADFALDVKFPFLINTDVLKRIEELPCLNISDDKKQVFLDFHSFIVKQYNRIDYLYRDGLAKILLSALAIELISVYTDSQENEFATASRKEEVFKTFMKLVIKHHRQDRSIIFYANKMFLTPKYMAQVIKGVSGKSALNWINDMTILSIKAMLKSSNFTILQISEELNFSNPSFFGRFFKDHTGLTPSEYRKTQF